MLHLVVALPAEARPLAAGFGLRFHSSSGRFRLYHNDRMRLILSGPGKSTARAAVEHLHSLHPPPCAWLNLGIAGHGREEIGALLLARKIIDPTAGTCFHPLLPSPPPCATTVLCTVDRPEEEYARPWAYDMEGSGFFEAACAFAASGQVHCLKIVSDNPHISHRRISAESVEELLSGQVEQIGEVIEKLFGADPFPG